MGKKKAKRFTEKLKIRPKYGDYLGASFSPFFTRGSSKPRRKGTATTDQTHSENAYIKDVRQQEITQPKGLYLDIMPGIYKVTDMSKPYLGKCMIRECKRG